ncbi:MAG: hypothetical protein JSV56_05890 [Methanomassiliicoccales archaeon]|nr:MAG: hypothetical protein JSV56_05890 [Methanomassiliicoccales archaeon]
MGAIKEQKEDIKKMTAFSCPGATRIKEPVPEFFRCKKCGAEIEIWTHEHSRKCQNCGNNVLRDEVPTCIEWCEYGKECVGDEAYHLYMKAKGTTKLDKKRTQEEEKKMKEYMEKIKKYCQKRSELDGEKTDNQDR